MTKSKWDDVGQHHIIVAFATIPRLANPVHRFLFLRAFPHMIVDSSKTPACTPTCKFAFIRRTGERYSCIRSLFHVSFHILKPFM